jgi:parallel beta-helix repeat protein
VILAIVALYGSSGSRAPAAATGHDACTKTLRAGDGSLSRFVQRLRPGQVGCLRGTFRGHLTIRNGGFRLTSAAGERATLTGVVFAARTSHDVILSRLLLRSRETPTVRINGRRITLVDSEITNAHTGIGISVGGGFERWGIARGIKISRNRIHACGRLPATNHDHGIYVEGAFGTVINGNLIYDCADRGVQFYPNAQGSTVSNNVIDGNGEGVIFSSESGGGEFSTSYASSGNVVARNIISNSRLRHNIEAWWAGPVGTGNVVRENCLWNGATGNIDLAAGGFLAIANVVANPRFVNRAAGDFRLEPGSPCAGMGPH